MDNKVGEFIVNSQLLTKYSRHNNPNPLDYHNSSLKQGEGVRTLSSYTHTIHEKNGPTREERKVKVDL